MNRWHSTLVGWALLMVCACGSPPAQSQSAAPPTPVSGSGAQAASATQASWADVEAAANKEGSVTVYALTTIPADQVVRVQEAWSKAYPGIRIDMTTGLNPPDVVAKVTAEQDAHAVTADVAQLGGTTGRQLDRLGELEPFIPPATQDTNQKWRTAPVVDDAHLGTMLAVTLSATPIWINTNLVPPGQEPQTHLDLTDPKWKGKILWQAPWMAGLGWNEYYLSKKFYGQDWVTKMQAQNIIFSQNQNDGMNQLARGEAAIALADGANDLANRLIQAGQPLKAVWPDDFVYGSANGFSVIKGGPHPNAAKVFVNWWFTQDGQQLMANFGQFPNRTDVQLAQTWMKGSDTPKLFWYPTSTDDAQSAPTQKEAAAAFKN
jgi:iron(III) transport system substrate-binding protein